MSFIGKVFILISLAGYSYLLIQDATVAKSFDLRLKEVLAHPLLKQLPLDPVKPYLTNPLLVRQVVAGLLSSSALLFLCGWLVLFPFLGIVLRTAIVGNPLTHPDQLTQIEFLKSLALLGGVLLWASTSCCKSKNTKVKSE